MVTRLNVGGPAVHAILLTAGLDPGRFDQLLVTGREGPREGNMLELAAAKGVAPLLIPELRRELSPWEDAVAAWRLYRLFRTWRPDIVETHTAKAGMLGRVAARLAGVPVVLHTFHGHVFHSYFGRVVTRCYLQVERALARCTTRILVLGQRQRAELLGYGIGGPEQMVTVPLVLELEPFFRSQALRGQLRAELGIDPARPAAGIVGRLAPIKAHEVFLAAAAAVHRQLPDADFLVVGDGERRAALEALSAARGLGHVVRFLGWRRDLARVYADLDVVALCSLNEGLPSSILEAMASAKPVVATDVGEVPTLVEDGQTGFLVPARDPVALADRLGLLLRDRSLAARMGAAARAACVPYGTQALRRMSNLYEELAGSSQPAAVA